MLGSMDSPSISKSWVICSMNPLAYSSQSLLYSCLGVSSLVMWCFFSTLTSMGVPLTSKQRGKNTLYPLILLKRAAKSIREYPVACPK